ncbi:MAG: hybrid sensor histidine kinase/response regulator [bacterium]|nr:hybrid sensor histidine kinase/response regulator [bacterium]
MKKRILIIDDEEAIRLTVEAILEDEYYVKMAENGEDALAKIPELLPDLILADVDMPGMSGLDICRQIRKNENFKYIKVIILSGKVSLKDRLNGYDAGADDYIKKPFDEGELLSKVRVFMRLKNVEEVSTLKTNFLQLMAHEIKSPLNAIFLPAKMFLNDDSLSREDIKELMESIYNSAHWLHDNFKKMMMLLKLKAGRPFQPMYGLLAEYFSIALNKVSSKAQEKQVTIDTDFTDELGITADWEILSLAFQFLLDNAVKFSKPGEKIEISAYSEDGLFKMTIVDHGKGIAKESIPNIFNEFCIENIMYHQKGMGISLAICKLIMAEHNGTLQVESEPEKGARFTITLPCGEEE